MSNTKAIKKLRKTIKQLSGNKQEQELVIAKLNFLLYQARK